MQVTLSTFSDTVEAMNWVESKVVACADPTKPPKLHPQNWLLSEFWYSVDKGVEYEKCTKLSNEIERSARDATSSAHALDLHHQQPLLAPPPPPPAQQLVRHRGAVQKVTQVCNKLGKCITSCETTLPSRKRSLDEEAFKSLRGGLQRCRDLRERTLDELEDLRHLNESMDADDTLVALKDLAKQAQEHLQALQEAMDKSLPAPVKHEDAKQPDVTGEADGSASESAPVEAT